MYDIEKEELEIRTAEVKVCEDFVNGVFELSKKYNLRFPDEMRKLSVIVATSTINTEEEENVE